MGPIDCPATSVNNYQPKLRNIPKERRSQMDIISVLIECTYAYVTGEVKTQNMSEFLPNKVLNFSVQTCVAMLRAGKRVRGRYFI
jgi:hypothetical protein